jgi:hypothetical protein
MLRLNTEENHYNSSKRVGWTKVLLPPLKSKKDKDLPSYQVRGRHSQELSTRYDCKAEPQ